jgi:hypothetical protein
MRQFAIQRAFFEPSDHSSGTAEFGKINFNQLLLAIERAFAPPLVHRRTVFQPMQIVVVDPALFAQSMTGGEIQVETPKVLPRALPPPAGSANFAASPFQRRAVRGEILSDESGRLYEKLGRQIRPIHQLASGQFGEVIDLVPMARTFARAAKRDDVEPSVKTTAGTVQGAESVQSAKSSSVSSQPSQQQTTSATHRKLFADPGQWRVVSFGEFKKILAGQLAHPERLRDTYRLPCYVQVLQVERTISIDELAVVYKSENEREERFYFLTDEIAGKLDLVLPLRPAPASPANREPNTLLVHDRVFRLLAANDPTIDVTLSHRKPESSLTQSVAAPLKDAIPNHFVKEWEFKLTREEASYDMNAKASFGALLRNFCRRLRLLKRRTEFRKWRTLLAGRSVDEQLWAVRPPAGTLHESLVREWSLKMLDLGGYDSRKMMIEWEIFWRRRGL